MSNYIESFIPEDQKRIFRFFALFSRWECALKHHFPRPGNYGEAQAGWEDFGNEAADLITAIDSAGYEEARDYLLQNPPLRQHSENSQLIWKTNPKREKESDVNYLLRIVKDVRNNLFHGGKYQSGPIVELARDRRLIEAASTVLEACVNVDPRIREAFDEES